MRTATIAVVVCNLVSGLADLSAQTQWPIQSGDWVRVRFACTTGNVHGEPVNNSCQMIEGELAGVTVDSIAVHPKGATVPVALPLASVGGFERRQEGKSFAGRGARDGFLIGAVAGGVTLYLVVNSSELLEDAAEGAAALGVVGGGIVGAALGALVGTLIPTDHWVEVRLDELNVQPLITLDGRFGFAASVKF